jgi:hypothetical protein
MSSFDDDNFSAGWDQGWDVGYDAGRASMLDDMGELLAALESDAETAVTKFRELLEGRVAKATAAKDERPPG